MSERREVRLTEGEYRQLEAVLTNIRLKRVAYCREAALRLAHVANLYLQEQGGDRQALAVWLDQQLKLMRPTEGSRSRKTYKPFGVPFSDPDIEPIHAVLGIVPLTEASGTTPLLDDQGEVLYSKGVQPLGTFVFLAVRLCTLYDLSQGRKGPMLPYLPELAELGSMLATADPTTVAGE